MCARPALAVQPQPADMLFLPPLLRLIVSPIHDPLSDPFDDGMADLVAALREDEGLAPLEALCHAADMLDELEAYAAGWDSMAFVARNHTIRRTSAGRWYA